MKKLLLYVKYTCPICKFQKVKEFNESSLNKNEICYNHFTIQEMKPIVHCEIKKRNDILF